MFEFVRLGLIPGRFTSRAKNSGQVLRGPGCSPVKKLFVKPWYCRTVVTLFRYHLNTPIQHMSFVSFMLFMSFMSPTYYFTQARSAHQDFLDSTLPPFGGRVSCVREGFAEVLAGALAEVSTE